MSLWKMPLAATRAMHLKEAMILEPVTEEDVWSALEAQAADILRQGGLVAVPTETVYGLAADATNAAAIARIYAAKGRPSFNPLIVHVDGLSMAQLHGYFDPVSLALAEKFWPGPLTLVVQLRDGHGLAPSVTAGLPTLAIRQPVGPMARLAGLLDRPLAAPSANSSGKVSPTLARHVEEDLGNKVDMVLPGEPCTIGVESTIVKVVDGRAVILREGGVTREALSPWLSASAEDAGTTTIEAPGQLLAHYAPSIPVHLNRDKVEADMAFLGFGDAPCFGTPKAQLNLSVTGDVEEAARNLYTMLKTLDASGAAAIAVAPVPNNGIGAAINDRLKRAAHGSRPKERSS